MGINAVFKQPFAEQVAFFRGKLGNLISTSSWRDVQKSAHDTGFMVAGAAKADLLADLAAAVDQAISEGTGIEAFRKNFDRIVEKTGWSYNGEYNWRTRTIYRTNMATSYSAGRLVQLREGGFEYWMYRHSDSVARPRPLHVSWNRLTLPANDPWFKTHYPPNGWGCQCYVVGVSRKAAERLGGSITDAPDDGTEPDGRPKGLDKGWDYMPGEMVSDTVRSMAEKTVQWDYSLTKAYMQNVPDTARDSLAVAYRALPSVADEARRYAERALGVRNGSPIGQLSGARPYRTLGLLTTLEADHIARLTNSAAAELKMYDWAFDQSAVRKVRKDHGDDNAEAKHGQAAVTVEDYSVLARVISEADRIEFAGKTDVGRLAVRVIKRIGWAEYVAVFELRTGRRTLALQSMWKRGRPPSLRP